MGFAHRPRQLPIPRFAVKRYWHARYHNDAGNRWLRNVCAELFRQQRGAGRKKVGPAVEALRPYGRWPAP